MTRISLWIISLSIALPLSAQTPESGQKKFYVTGFGNDCLVKPKVCYGKSRVDAYLNCRGITVWTEKEWLETQKKSGESFQKTCDAIKNAGECPEGKSCILGKDGKWVVMEPGKVLPLQEKKP